MREKLFFGIQFLLINIFAKFKVKPGSAWKDLSKDLYQYRGPTLPYGRNIG